MKEFFRNQVGKPLAKAWGKMAAPLSPVTGFYNKYLNYPVVNIIWLALVLDVIIESLNRGGISGCLDFIADSPQIFLYDGLILLATLSVGLLFKRRLFVYFIISAVWLILGTANGVILSFRTTPFTTADLTLLETGLGVLPNYLSNSQITLVGVGVVALIIALVLIFAFGPKCKKYSFKKSVISVVIIALALTGATQYGLSQNWLSTVFGNLGYAYKDYGFPYCFINTWLNTGVRQPTGYSEEMMKRITTDIRQSTDANVGGLLSPQKRTPNIVFVQLESFFDPETVPWLECSEDPVPNFRRLKENYSSGYLAVPVIGAGTANTEFEVMTGMRSRFFGPGEYPFKTVLTDHTVESIAYNLKNLGYGTHAVHNHRGVFYGRNQVYKNLGYDTFTSLEYMVHAKMNPRNWAKDDVLTEEIMLALDSTKDQKDLVFTISVQGHGKYPTKKVYNVPKITVGGIESKSQEYAWEYYVNQINEMDEFVGQLTDTLENFDEDTVVVFYGDHLPSLGLENSDVECGDIYQTEYVIWSNFRMRKVDTDLRAYQLSATLMGRLGIEEGILTKFHETQQGKPDYLSNLQALQYDMLYGKEYVYGGVSPYKPADMKMGILDIKVTGAFELDGHTYVKGQNFTPYSKITIDGEILNTVFLDSSTLRVPDGTDISDLSKLKISQVEKNKAVLSVTE